MHNIVHIDLNNMKQNYEGVMYLRKISDSTKEKIFDLLRFYPYFGKLLVVDFLDRVYNLDDLDSLDPRYAPYDEIRLRLENKEYQANFVFEDDRFGLKSGEDEVLLRFLCEMFHPDVRSKEYALQYYLNEINKLLKRDGYIIQAVDNTLGREIYGWRLLSTTEHTTIRDMIILMMIVVIGAIAFYVDRFKK